MNLWGELWELGNPNLNNAVTADKWINSEMHATKVFNSILQLRVLNTEYNIRSTKKEKKKNKNTGKLFLDTRNQRGKKWTIPFMRNLDMHALNCQRKTNKCTNAANKYSEKFLLAREEKEQASALKKLIQRTRYTGANKRAKISARKYAADCHLFQWFQLELCELELRAWAISDHFTISEFKTSLSETLSVFSPYQRG